MPKSTTHLSISVLVCLASMLSLLCHQQVDSTDEMRPHIVMILADDLGYADLGQDGSRILTPNLDRQRADGIKLTQFYASARICSPTRAALLTGRYPHTVSVPELCSPEQRGSVPVLHLALDAVTMPEVLKKYGYTCCLAGKWHLGYPERSWPRQHGFDEFWGSLAGTPKYFEPVYTYHNETEIQVKGYYTDRITDAAVRFIEDQPTDKPLFLFLSYNAPHYPLEAPAELIEKYQGVFEEEQFAIYAAMVERMDTGVGRVLDALLTRGFENNTLVVFTSDSGPSPEPPAYGLKGARRSAGPLKGHKFSVHEGGIRVPFLGRWPKRIEAGLTAAGPATVMDLFPTFLEAAQIESPPGLAFHGRSVLPVLEGEATAGLRTLHWETRLNYGLLQGPWKLVRERWRNKSYLYNLDRDLGEEHDLADTHPGRVAALEALHSTWRSQHYPVQFPAPSGRPKWSFPEQ